MVHGDINPDYLADLSGGSLTNTNFIVDDSENINSISLLAPADYHDSPEELPNVYKVFSQGTLTEDELNGLFKQRNEVVTCDWQAYPHYSNVTLTPFKLAENLYHINAIEWAASAMEMSVIGAQNVANMVAKRCGKDETKHSRDEL